MMLTTALSAATMLSPPPVVFVASFAAPPSARTAAPLPTRTTDKDWSRVGRKSRVSPPRLSRPRPRGAANDDGGRGDPPPLEMVAPPSESDSSAAEARRPSTADAEGNESKARTNDDGKGIDAAEPFARELDSIAQILDAIVALKEKTYAIIRQILADIVTIVERSVAKARDWAVEDEAGQLITSALALVGFFALVAAFAAWNISVLSGGRSVWAGPQNGITVPAVRLPPDVAATTSVKFQKPRWKAPEIRTSYGTGGGGVDGAEGAPTAESVVESADQ